MLEDLHLNLNTLVGIVAYVVSVVVLITRMDGKQKSSQEISDLRFLAATDKTRQVETQLTERIRELELDAKENSRAYQEALSVMNQKLDVLNREVLNKLFDIEKTLERLKGQLGITEPHRGG